MENVKMHFTPKDSRYPINFTLDILPVELKVLTEALEEYVETLRGVRIPGGNGEDISITIGKDLLSQMKEALEMGSVVSSTINHRRAVVS